MAHKKGASSSRNGRDSNAQRLGVKRFGGQSVSAGEILVRQRGTHFHPGVNFGQKRGRKTVNIVPAVVAAEGRTRVEITRSAPIVCLSSTRFAPSNPAHQKFSSSRETRN
eukprot:gene23313-27955_t